MFCDYEYLLIYNNTFFPAFLHELAHWSFPIYSNFSFQYRFHCAIFKLYLITFARL